MSGVLLLLVTFLLFILAYIFYGGWLAKQWGLNPQGKTPAHELYDGVDYVPAKAPVLLGHHFASIAEQVPSTVPFGRRLWMVAGHALDSHRQYIYGSRSRFWIFDGFHQT